MQFIEWHARDADCEEIMNKWLEILQGKRIGYVDFRRTCFYCALATDCDVIIFDERILCDRFKDIGDSRRSKK